MYPGMFRLVTVCDASKAMRVPFNDVFEQAGVVQIHSHRQDFTAIRILYLGPCNTYMNCCGKHSECSNLMFYAYHRPSSLFLCLKSGPSPPLSAL